METRTKNQNEQQKATKSIFHSHFHSFAPILNLWKVVDIKSNEKPERATKSNEKQWKAAKATKSNKKQQRTSELEKPKRARKNQDKQRMAQKVQYVRCFLLLFVARCFRNRISSISKTKTSKCLWLLVLAFHCSFWFFADVSIWISHCSFWVFFLLVRKTRKSNKRQKKSKWRPGLTAEHILMAYWLCENIFASGWGTFQAYWSGFPVIAETSHCELARTRKLAEQFTVITWHFIGLTCPPNRDRWVKSITIISRLTEHANIFFSNYPVVFFGHFCPWSIFFLAQGACNVSPPQSSYLSAILENLNCHCRRIDTWYLLTANRKLVETFQPSSQYSL